MCRFSSERSLVYLSLSLSLYLFEEDESLILSQLGARCVAGIQNGRSRRLAFIPDRSDSRKSAQQAPPIGASA